MSATGTKARPNTAQKSDLRTASVAKVGCKMSDDCLFPVKQTTMDSGMRVAVSDCSMFSRLKVNHEVRWVEEGCCSFDDGKSEGVGLC